MKIFMFHLMPYAYLDPDHETRHAAGVWTTLPNSYFDPEKGHELYNRYLDELELAAELGFDGISVNEHHQTAYGMMPSPIVTASALARRTTGCKIAILGSGFCLRDHPLTLAEEHAMLDCITGGRVISGFVRGIGAEYYTFGANPVLSHERHLEAHDLVVRAWTETGPFAFEGKHYHFEYVNIWPRPYQRPHPPIWCPSQGSTETIEWAAHPDRKYVYAQTHNPLPSVARYLNLYRELAETRYGYTAAAEQLAWGAPCYVAETDERAIYEARPHIEYLFNTLFKMPFNMYFPPGYTSRESFKRVIAGKMALVGGKKTIEELNEHGIIICGSADTVRRRLTRCHHELGMGHFICHLQFGTLPRDLTENNIRLFASAVMPALQSLGDNDYRGFEAGTIAVQ